MFDGSRTVSAVSVVDLANELLARGLLSANELAKLSPSLHECIVCADAGQSLVERRLPECDLVALWRVAEERKNSPSLGFDIGRTVNAQAKGLLAHWISCCDSLGEVLGLFIGNVELLNGAEKWVLEREGDQLCLTFEHDSLLHYPPLALERSLVALLAWGEYFCGRKIDVQSASFVFDAPQHSECYRQIFGMNLVFGAIENRIVLDAQIVDWPVLGANRYLRELLAQRCDSAGVSASTRSSVTVRVERLLRQDLPLYSQLSNTLGSLHMSRTSLYRKLKLQGVQFSGLLLQARLDRLAALSTQAPMSSETYAQELGFTDVSSYYRFLKRVKNSH